MANVIVSELAKAVGTPVESLLNQMKGAGLTQDHADAIVSDEEKQILLAYLKSLHNDKSRDPKKITLKRKTLSTLKTSAGRKTVNVEVRKKRTYVKPDEDQLSKINQPNDENKLSDSAPAGSEDKRQASIIANKKLDDDSERASEKNLVDETQNEKPNNLKTPIESKKKTDLPVLDKSIIEQEKPKKHQKNYTTVPIDDDKEEDLKKPKKRASIKESKQKIIDLLKAVND